LCFPAMLATALHCLAQPVIITQPLNLTDCLGEAVTFSVEAIGTAPITYQWRSHSSLTMFTNMPGETNATLVLTNASKTWRYAVLVSDASGLSVTSQVVRLQVNLPIGISSQPTGTNLEVGSTFTCSATVTGSAPVIQWYHDDQPLSGKTASTLTLYNVQPADAGDYWFTASNGCGLQNSDRAPFKVYPVPFAKVTAGELWLGDTDMEIPYWVDYNGDGLLDLVVSRGAYATAAEALLVYDNQGDGTFRRNLTSALATTYGHWTFLTWGDYDNDGILDLFGARGPFSFAPGAYFHGEGGGQFSVIGADSTWTVNGQPIYGTSSASADYDQDGWLDMVVGYWGNWGPTGIWGTNSVLHNVGGGHFEVDLGSALALSHTWPEQFSWVDYDDDGDLDLFTVTSWDTNQVDILFENRGGGVFQRITNSPLVQTPDFDTTSAWGDYDNDGDPDVVIPSANRSRFLYRNLGHGVFELAPASPTGLLGYPPRTAVWGDYDNDGHLDLFLAHWSGPLNRLLHNRGDGTFEELVKGGPVLENDNYAGAWGDYDNDGFLDLILVKYSTPANNLYRNVLKESGNTNRWLKVAPRGTLSNRAAIGATVRVKATIGGQTFWQRRQIVSQSVQLELTAHFGLGDANQAEIVRIEWPSGDVSETHNVPANQMLTVVEPNLKVARSANKGTVLTLNGRIGSCYDLHVSTDLHDWVPWQTITCTNRSMTLLDPEASSLSHRFYRSEQR
jgi:enediyne biosynthesis protein E4